ncbi:hypothetical protein G3O08_00565 [Cryomorpha ignava]|uniref:PKD domain-containing protein n=1 Tax=Cryomorpha ignava TaxID=101383 RepID=A0A7K3WMR9_9FLAO|nr:gliding motility-associated C-terminal domain-containing protein [Cryomorpha ignava]NEN21995.1 hypothetical protein [Cryomorpha ignava]
MSLSISASHISGVNISYECLGDDDYLITVNLFRDCQDLNNLPANLNVYIGSTCLNIGYQAFPQIDLIEVSQLCAAELPNSTCNGGFQPGVQMGVYQAIVELEPCIDWRIIVSEQNRDGAIVNLVDPELFSVHAEAFLNNSSNICNSSPELSLLNLPYICVGTPLFYNLGFIDADGDSLAYSLVPALSSPTPNLPVEMDYTGSYSGAEPITGMTIDPITGQIVVTPTQLGKFNAVVEVREYRNGNLIGIVHYDFLFLVNVCAIPPPEPDLTTFANVSGGGYPIDENTVSICPEDDFCFEIDFTSIDPSINVDLNSNIGLLIPGATETVTGTNPATIQFCGTLPPDFNGGSFIITAIDDACPVYGQNFYTIDFAFRQPIQAFSDTTICLGESVQISAINDTSYTWYSLSGELISAPDAISCNPCQQASVSPDTSTYYVVEGQYANSNCANRDTILIDIPLRIDATVFDETCTGNDGIIEINVLTGSGDYDVIWDDIGDGPLLRNDLVAGTYYVLIFDNANSCSRIDTFNLIQLSPPITDAGIDFEICGLSANLAAIPSYGIPSWSNISGASFINNADENTSVTVTTEGTYAFVWNEDAGVGCFESDTVEVTFYAQPSAQILNADSVCGLQVGIDAVISNGAPQWSATSGINIDDPLLQNTEIQADSYGISTLYIQVENGLCLTADTAEILFIEQPVAYAGTDVEVCGNEAEISGIDAIGNGEWSLPAGISSTQDLTDLSITITGGSYGSFDIIRTLVNQLFCSDSDTATVIFTEIPVVALGGDQNVCDSLTLVNFTLPIGDLNWELSPNLTAIASVAVPQELSGDYGIHQAILHADNGYGCIHSDTLNLNFVVQPALQAVLADTVCGLEYVFNAETIAETAYWLPPNNATISDLANPNSLVTANVQGDYIFQWVAENGGFCLDTSDVAVTFYNQPVSNAGENLMICGLSTTLDATSSAGVLLWEDQPGLTFTNPLSQNSLLAADWYGNYSISLTETNGICADSDTVEIQFISTPEILNPQWECTGTDAEFVLDFDVSLGDTANYEVQGLPGTLTNFHFTSNPLASDTPIAVILEDFGYCGGDTLTGTLFCPILTNAGLMDPDTMRLCGNELVEALPTLGSVLDGNDTLLYAFHDGSANALGTVYDWNNSPEFLFSAVLDFNETYFISAVAGNELDGEVDLNDPLLSVSAGTPVEFYALPYGEISGSFNACPYDTVFIPVDLGGAMPQEITYSVAGQIYSVFADSSDFSIAIVDSGAVNLISTNSQFCTGEVNGAVSLSYFRIPEASISGPPIFCAGDTALIEVAFDGEAPFSGNILQDGAVIQSINTTADSLNYLTTTGGNFSVLEFSDQNCSSFDTVNTFLIVNPLPVVSAGENLDVCNGDTILIGDNSIPGQQYSWQPNTFLLATNLAQVEFAAQSNSPFPQTSQVVVLAELNGCFETDSAVITVFPLPIPQIVGPTTVCSGDSIMLIGYGGASYEWSPAQYFANPFALATKFSASANTEIELTAITEAGCEAQIFAELGVLETPSAIFGVSEMSGCAPLDLELVALSENNENSYAWNLPGINNIPNNASVIPTLAEAGTYTVSLTVTSPNGCSKMEQWPQTIQVFSTSAAFKYTPEKPNITNPEVFFLNLSPNEVSSEWTIDSLVFSETRNASYTFPELIGGSYTVCLKVTDTNACTADYCEIIKLKNDFEIYVPTAFTPDGDGINDLFYPVLSNIGVTEYKFWITDPRGRVVFSTTDINGKWDGSSNGSEYFGENKIYNWHVIAKPEYNVETKYFTGHVMLLR